MPVLSFAVSTSETLMPYIINTGTRLVEEGPLLPEFLRFESEPWTSFYIASEIIRELWKGLEIK